MHVNAHLDIDLVAVEQTDQVTVMLELSRPRRPPAPSGRPRACRSSSTAAGRCRSAAAWPPHARRSRRSSTAWTPATRSGWSSSTTRWTSSCLPAALTDKPAVKTAIAAVHPRGGTNLSAGLLRGIQEARRAAGPGGATLLLVSDGMANQGVTEPERLEAVACNAHRGGVSVSTVGIGLGYDEQRPGRRRPRRAGRPRLRRGGRRRGRRGRRRGRGPARQDRPGRLAAHPPDRRTSQSVHLYNDLPAQAVDGGVMVELGDLWAGEERKLLLGLGVPAIAALGLAQIATLELRYVTLPELSEQTVTLPISVNVVPGDQAAGRIADPRVRTELLFQQAQDAKRRAADAIARGDHREAMAVLGEAGDRLAGRRRRRAAGRARPGLRARHRLRPPGRQDGPHAAGPRGPQARAGDVRVSGRARAERRA